MLSYNYANMKKLAIKSAMADFNMLIMGTHGVGKTYLVTDVANELNLKLGYWSASTMDPYIDLVGVPYPDSDGMLKFAMREDIFEMEMLFFDELNRAPLKVRNSILELVQFKRINGRELPKLRFVWCAINPPTEDYQVEELDPALKDRFHVHCELRSEPDPEYYRSVLKTMKNPFSKDTNKIAARAVQWWEKLQPEEKENITPRRLEYICRGWMFDFDIKDMVTEAVPEAQLSALQRMLEESNSTKLSASDMLDPTIIRNRFDDVLDSMWS